MREIKFISADWRSAFNLIEQLEDLTTKEPVYIRSFKKTYADHYYVAYSFDKPINDVEAQESFDKLTNKKVGV